MVVLMGGTRSATSSIQRTVSTRKEPSTLPARGPVCPSSTGGHMPAFSISSDGKLVIAASETSSQSDFDYLIGNWNIRNRTLKEPLAGSDEWKEFDATQACQPVLFGLGNFDIFHTELEGKPFEGLTVRLFDPLTRL